MSMLPYFYIEGKYRNQIRTLLWESGADMRVALVTPSYSPDSAHEFLADITNELSGGNYVRKTLAGLSLNKNTTANRVEYKANDIVYSNLQAAAGNVGGYIVYEWLGSDAASYLLLYQQVPTYVPDNSNLVLRFNSTGVFWV